MSTISDILATNEVGYDVLYVVCDNLDGGRPVWFGLGRPLPLMEALQEGSIRVDDNDALGRKIIGVRVREHTTGTVIWEHPEPSST